MDLIWLIVLRNSSMVPYLFGSRKVVLILHNHNFQHLHYYYQSLTISENDFQTQFKYAPQNLSFFFNSEKSNGVITSMRLKEV